MEVRVTEDGRGKRPVVEALTDAYIIFMLLVFPLFTGFRGYRGITMAKFALFAGATGLWLAALIALALMGKCERRRLRPAHFCVLGYMLAACLSALLSPYGAETIFNARRCDGLVALLLYGGVFFGVSLTCRPKRAYVWALGASTLLCCCLAALQLLGRNPLGLYPGDWNYYGSGLDYSGAFLGSIGNTNLLSGFLCLGIPLFAAMFIENPRRDWPLLIPALAGLLVLAASRVSGGAVALIFCALVSAPVLARRKRGAAALICLGIAAAGLLLVWLWPGESGTVYELSQVLRGNFDDSFGSSRLRIWRETLALFPERPILGGGPDTLRLRLDLRFSRFVPETGRTLSVYIDNAHNEYLGDLINLGIAGLACRTGAMVCTFLGWLRAKNGLLRAVGCALVCYWAQAFFGLGLCLVLPLMWLLWGVFESGTA